MSEELIPCPFCGGEHVELICMGTRKDDPHVVECDDCDATASGMDREEAVANWNRRAERTCRNDSKVGSNSPGWLFDFRCSECGAELCAEEMGNSPLWVDGDAEPISYCPNCGAKVVDDD